MTGTTVTIADTTPPTVSGISSTLTNGSYKAGHVVPVTITFSEAVTVTGTPQLTLSTGTPSTTAINYTSGSGTAVLTFNYTVASGNTSADLDYAATTSLAVNGGTIRDTAGNDGTLTLAAPGASGSLGNAKALVIDTTPPTVTGVSVNVTSGILKIVDVAIFTVTFDGAVTITGSSTLLIETGTIDRPAPCAIDAADAANLKCTYTVAEGDTAPALDYAATSSLTGTIADAAGNAASLALPSPGGLGSPSNSGAASINGVRPAVTSIVRAGSAGALTNASPVFTVTFSESVAGVVVANFAAVKGSGTSGTATYLVSGSGTTWTVTVSGLTGDYGSNTNATVGLTVAPTGASVTNAAGNALASGTFSGSNQSYNLDTNAPTYAITYLPTAPLKAGAVTITVTASEALSATPTISIDQQGSADIASAAMSGTGPYTYAYTVVTANAGTYVDGTATVTVSSGSDIAGNTGTSITSGGTFTIDTTSPTATAVTFLSGSASGPFKSGGSVTMSVTAGESLSVAPVVTFSGAGTPTVTLAGSGTAWTGTVANLTGDGAVTYTMVLTDLAGNAATTSSASAFTVDNTAPTYVITYSRTAPLNAGAVTITVAPNEALSAAPTITISQPGTTDISSSATIGDGPYTYSYMVVAANAGTYVDGTATVMVSGSDAAGNTGTSITSGSTFTVDTTAPSVALTYSIDTSSYTSSLSRPVKSGDTVTLKATMTEAVALSGAPTLTLTATGGVTVPSAAAMTQVGSTLAYTATYAVQVGQNGTVSASVAATDTASNSLTSTATTAFIVDNTAPTVVLAYSDGGASNATGPYKSGNSVTVTATFTEANAIPGTPTLSLVAGSYVDGTLPTVTLALGSGTTYTGTFEIPVGNGTVTATVGATDAAGNALSATGQTGFTIDNVAPTVALGYSLDGTIFASSLTRPAKSGDIVTVKATFTESVGLFGTPTFTLTQNGNATVPSANTAMSPTASALEWTYAYAVPSEQNATISASVSAADTAGNTLATTAATAFVVDNAAPGILIAYSDGGAANATGPYKSGDSVTVTATFTEANAISGTPTLSLVVGTYAGGTLPAVTLAVVSGTTYTGTFEIPIGNGTVTATVGATDTAGNVLSASNQAGFTIDNVAPTVVLTYSDGGASNPTGPYRSGDIVTVTATFIEANAIASTPTLSLVAGNYTDGTLPTVTLSGSGLIYTGTFTIPLGNGTVTATVNATDTANNGLSATGQTGFIIDNVAPAVALAYTDSGAADVTGPYKSGNSVTVTATFTEVNALSGTPTLTLVPGTYTGGTLPVVTLSNGGSGLVYSGTFAVPVGNGTVTATVGGSDTANNTLSATGQAGFTIDNLAPAVALAYSDGGAANATGPYKQNDSVTVTATFTETNALSGTPTLTLVAGSHTGGTPPTVTLSGSGLTYVGTFTIPAGNGAVTATVGATDTAGNVLSAIGQTGFTVDNVNPDFSSTAASTTAWYAAETPTFTVAFSEPVIGVASGSFTLTHGPSIRLVGDAEPSITSVSIECAKDVTISVGLRGATGDGTASSTFTLTVADITGITDCAGNALNAVPTGRIASSTFTLFPGTRPAPSTGSGGDSGSDAPAPVAPAKPVAPVVVAPPVTVTPAWPPAPTALLQAGAGSAAAAQAFNAITPAKAQAIGAALASIPPAAAQAFGAALGAAGAGAATALLDKVANLPPAQVAAVASVTGSLPAEAAGALVTTLAALPQAQLAAVADVAAALAPAAATQVFSAIASLAQAGSGPISFAPPAKVETSASGLETVSFEIADDEAVGRLISDVEVAGVHDAPAARRTVVVLVKPAQVGRINRPRSGNWPDLALPVTAGKQAGLTPIFSLPADATAITFEPTPGNLNVVQQGSLGGGTVVPMGSPFAVTVASPPGAAEVTLGVQMPSIAVATGDTFAYLFSTGGGTSPGFVGYLRAPAEFDPPTGRQKWTLRLDESADVLFLPVALRPAFVQNFSEDARIFSSPGAEAIDFGIAGPQFTTFTVVAPQVRNRIYVFNPVTKGYGWINANEVGPSGPPKG